MKKLLLSFLLCPSFIGFAQDWNPFPLGQKSFYQDVNNDNVIQVFHCDTVYNNGAYQTMYFSNTEERHFGCFNNIYNQPYFNSAPQYDHYYSFIRPNSIKSINDTLYFRFNSNYYVGNDSFIFLPKIPQGLSWFTPLNHYQATYNCLKFTCDSIYFDTIIGNVTDSVKLISVKAYNNTTPVVSIFDNQKIILSKNYGYKQLVSFSGQNQYPYGIIGLETSTIQQGFYYPDFTDYFHLNVGDVLIWQEDNNGDPGIPGSWYTYYYKDSLMESFVSSDSVYYKFNRQKAFGTSYPHYFSTTREKMSWLNNSTTIYKNINSINTFTPYDLSYLSPIFKYNTKYEREYYFDGLGIDTNHCILTSAACAATIEKFDTYIGLNYQSFTAYSTTTFNVIGSTVGGISQGTPWNMIVTNVTENTLINPTINIYPNPSQSGNFVLESEQVKSVELLSIDGKTIFTQTINQSKTELKTGLPKGLYFAKITFKNKKQVTQKLIVSE